MFFISFLIFCFKYVIWKNKWVHLFVWFYAIDVLLVAHGTMSKEHAMSFHLIGSVVLVSLLLLFKFLTKDLVNAILTSYFFILGIIALSYVFKPYSHCRSNVLVWLIFLFKACQETPSMSISWVFCVKSDWIIVCPHFILCISFSYYLVELTIVSI